MNMKSVCSMKVLLYILIGFSNVVISVTIKPTNEETIRVADNSDVNNLNETNFFLQYIFEKYGSHGKISYEGFEHLLENLGLGQIKFEENHTLYDHKHEGNDSFEEIHDELQIHKHNHLDTKSRNERSSAYDSINNDDNKNTEKATDEITDHCYTTEEMLSLYNLEADHKLGISPTNFLSMCPLIIYELDHKSCHLITHSSEELKEVITNIYFVWLSASGSILIISLVGLIGVCMVPLLQKAFFNELISFLVALAVGTLCGDSLLHLLPHAFEKEEFESDSVIIMRAGTVFLSVMVFFLIETLLNKSDSKVDDSIGTDLTSKADVPLREEAHLQKAHSHSHTISHSHNHKTVGNSMSAVAFMVIMGDGLHNLTDGLAVGAAFSGDIISGFTTAIAVFTHELPHELGDFAVLLQSGMTVSQAVFYNIVSSILSFIGMAAGILLGNYSSASQWIYAVTAGVFLYIGLVNLVPEMKRSGGSNTSNVFIQVSGILCGGLIMFLIALYEHDLEYLFLQ